MKNYSMKVKGWVILMLSGAKYQYLEKVKWLKLARTLKIPPIYSAQTHRLDFKTLNLSKTSLLRAEYLLTYQIALQRFVVHSS